MKRTKLNKFRFNFNAAVSPTYANLQHYLLNNHWTATRYAWRSHFSEKNFAFDELTAQQLEYKHLLAELTQRYCPHTMPLTYVINDNNSSSLLTQLMAQADLQNLLWILKPSLLNNGQHIKLFNDLMGVVQHYSQHQRLGGEHVLQQYIDPPHLLKEHKYSVRMFVILTNYDGAFIYPHGYFNVAKLVYDPHNLTDLMPHLTNEHIQDPWPNVIQIPTDRFDYFDQLYPQIQAITQQVLSGLIYEFQKSFVYQHKRKLAIFGFDFLVDANSRVWLLEANHGPCFPVNEDHPLQKYLYQPFWEAFIKSFVLPIATKQNIYEILYSSFERVGNAANITRV